MDRCRRTIRIIKTLVQRHNNHINKNRNGRPRKVTNRECSPVVRKIKANLKIKSTQVAAETKADFGKDVRCKTVKISLQEILLKHTNFNKVQKWRAILKTVAIVLPTDIHKFFNFSTAIGFNSFTEKKLYVFSSTHLMSVN